VQLPPAPGRAFLYNFYTSDSFRGRGLYPALLLRIRYELGREGTHDLIIDVDEPNVASRRGIAKAGFTPAGAVTALVLLNKCELALRRDLHC
jgi:RimJ/RimL family protein N-acetyltransferase